MCELTDYQKYRGKCKEMVDAAVLDDQTLRAVRGHYHCPLWGEQPHWWCVRSDGSIYDPSAEQFPFGGAVGEYVEFNGRVACANCGKEIAEDDADIEGNYAFCSYECHGRFVGVF